MPKTTSEDTVTGTAAARRIGERLILVLGDETSAALPSRGQVAVHAELATAGNSGTPRDLVVEPDGRRGHWIPVDGELAAELGVQEGAIVELSLRRTEEWPEVEVPDDLALALEDAGDLDEHWDSLTPLARWEWVRWIGATRNPDTRAKRVVVGISKLHDGKRRPCCFDLSSCTDPELARSGKLIEQG